MTIEVNAQDVIAQLLEQNKQLVAEVTVLKVVLGLNDKQDESKENVE